VGSKLKILCALCVFVVSAPLDTEVKIVIRIQAVNEGIENNMARIQTNTIEIEYETFGSAHDPALLLVSRLGGQLLDWDASLCKFLAQSGYFVIRFDNRDTGLSSKIEDSEPGAAAKMFKNLMQGEPITPLYTIEDMAKDALGLLNALQIQQAHVCGISMGGMIAQTIAIHYPERVLSLISIYSTTGDPDLPGPREDALNVLFNPAPAKRSAYIDYTVNVFKVISGSGTPLDTAYLQDTAGRYFDRSFCPQGTAHHLIAAMLQKNRKQDLVRLAAPTLVIHGDDDPLMPLAHGKDTAATIPDAELLIIEGMGHDLPMMNAYWQRIMDAMVQHMQKADS
jgi:pimeloyl-ACP methyl ester carboxylesterase